MARRSPLDTDPRFTRHRTLRVLWPGLLVLAIGLAGLVLATLFMPELVVTARREAEGASSTANAVAARFDPLWTWLLAVGTVLFGVFLLTVSVERRHAGTGHRLRRSLFATFDGGRPRLLDLYSRFASADPGRYTPLPELLRGRRWDTRLDIWEVPEDFVAYVALSTGAGRSTEHAGLLRYEGEPYAALMAAVRSSRLRLPAPAAHGPSAPDGPPPGVRGLLDPRVLTGLEGSSGIAVREEGDGLRVGGWEVDYLVRVEGDVWTITPRDRGRDGAPVQTNSSRVSDAFLLYYNGLPSGTMERLAPHIHRLDASAAGVTVERLERGTRLTWPDGSWATAGSSFEAQRLLYFGSTPIDELAVHAGGTLTDQGFEKRSDSR
ncbi:hypothetical protein [Naasia sp. SYSU D00057]|uniref:hypothetical protein n=1 Tax=Naasia sp. SYSU D00057 TaxID=2817380 RepID=UPI001B315D78|nr:hypothetical protein [Naasia sp. SYSU D00057]